MTSDLELDKDTEGRISMFSKFVEDSIQEMFAYLLSREQRLKEAQIGMFEHLIEETSQQLLSPERYKQYSSQRPLLNDLSSELNLYASKSLNDAIQNGEALPKLNDDSEQVHKERYLTIMNSLVLSDTQQISLTDFMNTIYIRESFLLRSRRSGISMDYFYLLKDIGSGAYASVHLVKHKFSGQLFALKKINKSKMKNLSDRIRLRIERCIMMRIRSSFIVGLHYAFYDDENIYFVMDYAAGGDMKSLLDIVGSVSEGWARRWFAEIVCAVLTLHGHIAHRGERHLDLHQNQPNAEVVNEIMADEARREANSHYHSSNSSDSNSSEFNDLTASATTNELSSHFTDSVLFEIQAKASLRSESAQPKVSLPLGSSPILSEAQRSAISSLQKAKLALQSSKVNANKIPAFSTGKLAPLPNVSFHQVSFDKMFLKFAIPPIPPPVVDVTPMNLVEKSDISNLIPPVPPIFSSKQSKQRTKTVVQKSLLSRMETAPTIDVDDSSSSSQQNQNSSHILSAKHYLLHTSSETPSGSVQRDSAGISENTTFTLNGLLSGLNQTSLWQPDSEDCIEAAPPAENVETTEASFLDGRDTDSSFILASRTRIENSSQRNLLVPGLSSSALGRPMIINAPPPEHSGDASLDCTTVHHIPNLALNGFRIPSHSLPSERFSLSSTTTQNLPRMQPSGHTMSLSTTNVLKNQQPAVKPTAPRCSQPIDPRSSQALPPKPPVPSHNLPCDESKQLIDIFVHRDLKPLNFLFRDDGHILLADFGLAEQLPSVDEGASPLIEAVKVSEKQTSATRISSTRETSSLLVGEREIVGTVEYMAPEIFNAPAYGRSVDYWALGLILYELLTGEVAFVASSPDELVQRLAAIKTEEDYDKCVSRPDFISDEAWDLIHGLMAHPTKRYGCSQHLHSLMDHPFFTRGYSRNQILNYQTPELQELIYAYKSYEETEAVEHTNEPFQFDEDLLDRLPVYPDEEFLYTLPTHWRPRTNNDADLKLFNERELKICGIIANDSGRYQAESLSEPDSESDSTSSDPVLLVPRSRDGNLSSRMSVRRSVHATKKLREILHHIPVETYKKARVRAEDPGAYSSVYHYTGGGLDENLVPSNVSSFSVDYLAGAASVVKDLLHSASSPTSRASCLDGSKIGTTGSSLNNMARNVDGLLANQNCDFPSHIRYNSEDSDNQDLIGDEGICNQNITDLYSLSSKTELTGLDSLEIATSSLSKVKMACHLSVAAPRMIVTDDSDQNRTFTTDEEDHLKTISQVSSKSSITTLLPVTDDEHLFTSLVEIIFQLGLDLDIEDMESSTEEAIVGLKSFALLTIVKDAHYNIPPCTFNTVVQSLQTASCLKGGRRITGASTGKDSSLLKHGLIYSTSRLSGSVFSYDSKPPTGIISGRIFNEDDTQQNSTDVPVSLTAALPDPCTQITGQASGIYSDSFPSFDVQSFHSVPLSVMSRNVDIKLIHIQEKMLTLSNKYLPNLFASSLESQRAVPPICEDPVSSALCIPYNKRTCVANAKSGTFFDWRHYTGFVTCIPNAPYISLETQVGCALGASVSLAIHLSQLGPKASKDCDSIFDSSRNISAASISVLSSPIPSCSPQYDGGGIAAVALSDVSSCPSLTSLVLRVDSVSSSMSQLCEIPGLDDMSKSSAVGCTHAPVDTYQQPADLVCNELSQRSTSSLKSPYEAAIESSFILPMSLKGSFYRENTGSLIELHTDTLVKNPPKSQSHSVKALGYALSQTSSPNELQTFMDTEIRTEGTPESVGILAQKTITSSFERPSGQISALDSDAPLSREECKEMTSKTSSFEGRQETCTSLTAVLSSVEEMKSADLFRSNPTEAKAASCNAVCNETSSQGIERQSTS
ncbi:Kinase, partial [Giardia lamblia P15]